MATDSNDSWLRLLGEIVLFVVVTMFLGMLTRIIGKAVRKSWRAAKQWRLGRKLRKERENGNVVVEQTA